MTGPLTPYDDPQAAAEALAAELAEEVQPQPQEADRVP